MNDFSDYLKDYSFELPEELIAQSPAAEREEARLLLVRKSPPTGMPRFEDLKVSDLPQVIQSEALLREKLWVRNRSFVIPARFYVRRPTGGKHEVLLLEEKEPGIWKCLFRGPSHFKYPQKLSINSTDPRFVCELEALNSETISLKNIPLPLTEWLRGVGEMPLPYYIKNRNQARDHDRYQTIWADPAKAKSVAAPTASLHFSESLLEKVKAQGVSFADLYLHVGLGTFKPIKSETLSAHKIHREYFEIDKNNFDLLAARQPQGFVSVGTTAMRTVESLGLGGESFSPDCDFHWQGNSLLGSTAHFIKPGTPIRYTKALWTNFHLPDSTLFVLVACFCESRNLALEAYRHAIQKKYRFFSYGDASLWI